ncbi:heterokaryon incompatibility protein-domain-containing protein [Rhexocercosporidium sp. MPI-PUGE-AT-0058]|nr:heterokaryon incompatibility protein-domain-containing protein [Rhexocercosporidium sp. MPI-PUGE-AT-0058]
MSASQDSTTGSAVCFKCQPLLIHPCSPLDLMIYSIPGSYRRASLAELAESTTQNCTICTFVLNLLRIAPEHVLSENKSGGAEFRLVWEDNLARFKSIGVSSFNAPTNIRRAPLYLDHIEDFEGEPFEYVAAESTGAASCLALAAQWLKGCVEDHAACREVPGPSNWLPSRLIDVGPCDGSQPPRLVLRREIHTVTTDACPPYFALSHRWGQSRVLKLLTSNIELLRQGLPDEELPGTFRDAIRVTRVFGVRYLWIDSLCIVQDSVDDWRVESLEMNRVYGNCLLNIAGTAASFDSAHGGRLFQDRLPGVVTPRPFRVQLYGHDAWYRCYDDSWERCVSDAPLNRRAWVLQERMLSARTLHFTEQQLFWECRSAGLSETHLRGLREYKTNRGLLTTSVPTTLKQWHASERMSMWGGMVQTYTSCGITKSEDKLVAIAGIAEAFSRTGQDEYLAGLWKGDLPYNLGWTFKDESGKVQRTEKYICPSWSWASVDANGANITNVFCSPRDGWSSLVKVVDAQVQPVGSDSFGALRGGYLRLAGGIGPPCPMNPGIISESHNQVRLYADTPDERFDRSLLLHCLPLYIINKDYVFLTCLLLKQIKPDRLEFVRVGWMNIYQIVSARRLDLPKGLKWLEEFVASAPSSREYTEITIY